MKRTSIIPAVVAVTLLACHAMAADPKKEKPKAEETKKPAVEKEKGAKPGEKVTEGPGSFKKLRLGPDGLPMPADRGASTAAKRQLDEAKKRLTTALSGTHVRSNATLEGSLWQDPEYRRAAFDLRRLQSDYDSVRKPIFDALKEDQYYKELEQKQRSSQTMLTSMVFMGRGTFDWLMPHALNAFDARQRMTREEILAMEQAPEVEDARKMMLRAAARVRAIRNRYIGAAATPASIKAAKEELEDARADVKESQARYNEALMADADYERLRQEYLEEYRRTGKPPEGK